MAKPGPYAGTAVASGVTVCEGGSSVTPSVDSLAALLDAFDYALLSLVGSDGRPRTRPVTPLKMRFNGHLWFEASAPGCAEEIGRGADVSVAYAATGERPCITVYGWAIVLHAPIALRSAWRQAPGPHRRRSHVICVSARAAEVWDAASLTSRRVFAFSGARPVCEVDAALRHEPALAPRLVSSSAGTSSGGASSEISCAQ